VGKHVLHQAPLPHQMWSLTVEHVASLTHVYVRCAPFLSLSHWGTCVVLSLALGHARCDPSLSHVAGLSRIGARKLRSLFHIGVSALCSLSFSLACSWVGRRMHGAQQEEEVWGAAAAGGGCFKKK
jgi:hypothetical protein